MGFGFRVEDCDEGFDDVDCPAGENGAGVDVQVNLWGCGAGD